MQPTDKACNEVDKNTTDLGKVKFKASKLIDKAEVVILWRKRSKIIECATGEVEANVEVTSNKIEDKTKFINISIKTLNHGFLEKGITVSWEEELGSVVSWKKILLVDKEEFDRYTNEREKDAIYLNETNKFITGLPEEK